MSAPDSVASGMVRIKNRAVSSSMASATPSARRPSLSSDLEQARKMLVVKEATVKYLTRYDRYSREVHGSPMACLSMALDNVGIHEYPVGRSTQGLLIHQDFLDQFVGCRHHSFVWAMKFMTDTKTTALKRCMSDHPGDVDFAARHARFIKETLCPQLPGRVQAHLTDEFKWWLERLPRLVQQNADSKLEPVMIDD